MNAQDFLRLVIEKHGCDDAENRLKETFFIIEANSYERFTLWEKYSPQSRTKQFDKVISWEQVNPGWLIQVGKIYNMPCMMSVSWDIINGKPVMFYYDCSQVTDSRKTEKWLKEHFDKTYDNGRRCETDASNFHHIFDAIKENNS